MKKRKLLNSATKVQEAQAMKDFGAALEGKPSSYRSAPYAVPASAKQVREARKLSGLAQPAFALAIGASPATVRSWEQGQKQPMGVASKLLRLLLKHPGLIKELAGDAGVMVARG
jgi:DNA-binding transcriptional regulator YiaG